MHLIGLDNVDLFVDFRQRIAPKTDGCRYKHPPCAQSTYLISCAASKLTLAQVQTPAQSVNWDDWHPPNMKGIRRANRPLAQSRLAKTRSRNSFP